MLSLSLLIYYTSFIDIILFFDYTYSTAFKGTYVHVLVFVLINTNNKMRYHYSLSSLTELSDEINFEYKHFILVNCTHFNLLCVI